MRKVLLAGLGLVMAVVNVGCVTTRVMDKDGNVVRETTSWNPVVVSPVVYDDGPVVYTEPVVVREGYPLVVVERSRYRPVVRVYREPYYPRRVRTVYIGHRHHRR